MKKTPLLLRVALVALALCLCTACGGHAPLAPEENAQSGTPYADQNKAAAPDAGSFRIVLNQQPTVQSGAAACNILAENPAENHYDLRVKLYLQETGELLGQTPTIGCGQNVEMLALEPVPAPGEHPALALLELLDEEGQTASTLQIEVKLVVQGESPDQPAANI